MKDLWENFGRNMGENWKVVYGKIFYYIIMKDSHALRSTWLLRYYTLLKIVPWHLGHGGNVSVESSKVILVKHFTHEYLPFPGFCPVLGILSPPKSIIFDKLYQL